MNILESIGNTPLVERKRVWNAQETGVRILAKLEGANPGGSVKDRPALYMIRQAVESGALTPDKTILEPTSGNTAIGTSRPRCSALCAPSARRKICMRLNPEPVTLNP